LPEYLKLAVAAIRAAYGDYTGLVLKTAKHLPKIITLIIAILILIIIVPATFFKSIFSLSNNQTMFPIACQYKSSFSNDFGTGRVNDGQNEKHEGIDIFADRNTPILAVQDCKIIKIGWNGLGGWRILLESTDGLKEYYYAHMENYSSDLQKYKDFSGMVCENPGISVKVGEIIGYVGSSGGFYSNSPTRTDMGTSPHIHFQMWEKGKTTSGSYSENLINPYYFLKNLHDKNK